MDVRKPLPPFGKALQTLLQQGRKPMNDIFLFIGAKAWQQAKLLSRSQCVLALVNNIDPDRFYWPVQGCSVLLIDTDEQPTKLNIIRKTAYILLCAGALIVRAILLNKRLVIYRKEAI